jgi:dTDP-4-amino-4,6-dideoxygalactose transaminase
LIPFNRPAQTGTEAAELSLAMASGRLSGDGPYSKRCENCLQALTGAKRALLTPSCTHALEMAALLIDLKHGDEVIMPSFTFVSTANAFALRGATVVFVDIRPDTLNIDENAIEAAITPRTRAIVPVHYAGVACEMDAILSIAHRHGLYVIEDAAQGIGAAYRERPLGAMGNLAALSFHETKNLTSGGEGGALLINDERLIERAEIIREKGTNRSRYFRGQVDKYTWVDLGSSYLPSELQSAYLAAQLNRLDAITADRLSTWRRYREGLAAEPGLIAPNPPPHCSHNGHIFHVRLADGGARDRALQELADLGIHAVFHYVPLHSAPGAQKRSRFIGQDRHTTFESSRLIRLPLWYGMPTNAADRVIEAMRAVLRRPVRDGISRQPEQTSPAPATGTS